MAKQPDMSTFPISRAAKGSAAPATPDVAPAPAPAPRVSDKPRVIFSTRLPTDLQDLLSRYAFENKLTKEKIVEEALIAFLEGKGIRL